MNTKPNIPNGEDLYNQLMRDIEPDLTTDQLPLLTERYASETPEEATDRKNRYKNAYEKYDGVFHEYIKSLTEQVHVYRKQALHSAEEKSRLKEQEHLQELESSFS